MTRSNLSHSEPKVWTSVSIASLIEEGLWANTTLLLGRRIKIHFPITVAAGGRWSSTMLSRIYKIEGSVDGKTHYMSFEDVLTVLTKSWFGTKALLFFLLSFLASAWNRIQEDCASFRQFYRTGWYHAMCCKAPDYEEWLESMTKEIKEPEKMPVGCWQIVKLTSSPPGAKLINCRLFYKLKSRDGLYERHRAVRLVAMGYQQEKGRDYFESFHPPARTLPFVSYLHSLIVGALVTWAIYTQGQLLLWSSLIITGVVPGYK